MLKPASTCNTSPVTPDARFEHKNAAELPTSSMVTVRRSAAVCSKAANIFLKFLMPDAASVRIGPAEIAFTRIPSLPQSAAITRVAASNDAFAKHITL